MRTWPLRLLSATLLLASASVALGGPSEVKIPVFTYELKGRRVVLVPPPEHHFNLKAPNEIRFADKELALTQLQETAIEAELPAPRPAGTVTATAFVCDRAKTYCGKKVVTFDVPAATGVSASQATSPAPAPRKRARHALDRRTDSATGFILNDAQKAMRLAEREKKPLLIDFFGIWCPPCNRLDDEVFHSPEFRAKVRGKVVLLQLDADEPVNAELKEKYRIQGLPTLILTTPKGDEITRLLGFQPTDEVIAAAATALAHRDEGYASLAARADAGAADARLRAAQIALDRDEPAKALAWLEPLKPALQSSHAPELRLVYRAELGAALAAKNTARAIAVIRESLGALTEPSIERMENLEKLADLADESGDARASSQAIRDAIATSEALSKNPERLKGTEYTVAELREETADLYDRAGEVDRARQAYQLCAEAYAAEAVGSKLGFARGATLGRAYCLAKAGRSDKSAALYRQGIRAFPREFTFHEAFARLLLDELKAPAEALKEADAALEYAYGNQRLKATLTKVKALEALKRPVPGIQAIDEALDALSGGPPSPGAVLLRKKLADKRAELAKQLSAPGH